MELLEDRKFCKSFCCGSCKHSYLMVLYNPNEDTEEYVRFCFCDGITKEDRDKIAKELVQNGYKEGSEYPLWFQQLMLLDPSDDNVVMCDRYVHDSNLCDKFMPIGPQR